MLLGWCAGSAGAGSAGVPDAPDGTAGLRRVDRPRCWACLAIGDGAGAEDRALAAEADESRIPGVLSETWPRTVRAPSRTLGHETVRGRKAGTGRLIPGGGGGYRVGDRGGGIPWGGIPGGGGGIPGRGEGIGRIWLYPSAKLGGPGSGSSKIVRLDPPRAGLVGVSTLECKWR
jgi:hypothetical protein